ncbi:MAG: dTDP-4-amino-4,6-dideoxygalactose transaminase [Bacteroidales bacterium]|nr:dTDP-4-amino-4,6-dideoxygalactose transaminase [Bacteroidales bacterium]
MIPFNKPHITGKEITYIKDAVDFGHISGNGKYTKMCHRYFEERWGIKKALLTTSCTDALEMCALLLNISPGDEVIMPSYTFVSTAQAFVRQGAKIVFIDSLNDHPGLDPDKIEEVITARTKVIVSVHYAGVACDMEKIMGLAAKYNLFVVEDAAQAIDSFFVSPNGDHRILGSIGHLAAFSFHETKNIQCGEGGLLVINDERFVKRAEIIWEKGTNRAEFFRGEVNKYGWVDIGSSFLPSDIIAAFLYAQLENLAQIQQKRLLIWQKYHDLLSDLAPEFFQLPVTHKFATNNGHIFYLVINKADVRDDLIKYLKSKDIMVVFHYLSLYNSPYFINKHDGRSLPMSEMFSNQLLRLPLYYELELTQIEMICSHIRDFFRSNSN